MHIISVSRNGETWTAHCSCGWSAGGRMSESAAWGVGLGHKSVEENNRNTQPGGSDDPYIGY